MTATEAFTMGVPFNAVNQIYQLGFPNFAWGNDAYLPTNVQKVGNWIPPQSKSSSSSSSSSKILGDAERATNRLLDLLERTQSQ